MEEKSIFSVLLITKSVKMLRYIALLYGYGYSEKYNCIELFQTSETRFHGHFLQRAQSSGLKLNK